MNFKNDFTYADEVQAQKDVYKGIEFRSKLESKTAQALDNIGIAWVYEPDGYKLSNGMWYRPDFWLPNAKQFVECKGKMTERDGAKICGLVHDTRFPVLALSYNNAMWFVGGYDIPDSLGVAVMNNDDYLFIGECNNCGERYFYTEWGSYRCPCCNYHDGDHTLTQIAPVISGTQLFDYGQQLAADKPAFKQIAENFNG